MLTIHSRKTLRHFLILAAAGAALSSHAALATPAGDAQAQARALLTGADAGASPSASVRLAPRIDAQEQARRLILGSQTPGSVAVAIHTADARNSAGRSHSAQESAQRMILGKSVVTELPPARSHRER